MNNKKCSSRLPYRSLKVFSKDTMGRFLHMGKQVREKHTQWKGQKVKKISEVSFLEHFSISSMLSMVLLHFYAGTPNVQFLVKVSMLELYNEEIVDLLSSDNQKLQIHEDKDKGIYVKDLSASIVTTVEEMNKKLK